LFFKQNNALNDSFSLLVNYKRGLLIVSEGNLNIWRNKHSHSCNRR